MRGRAATDICQILLTVATALLCAIPSAQASNTWDGGGGNNRSWSNPLNWSDDQLPIGAGTVTFPSQINPWSTVQDLFTQSSGIANSSFSAIDFAGATSVQAGSLSNALGMADDGRLVAEALLEVPLVTAGALRVDPRTSRSISIRSIVQQPGVITNVQIGTDAAHVGTVLMYDPSYTGTTTISRGTLLLGVLGFKVDTHDQGNYTIDAGAALLGNGTIRLSTGRRVDNAGTIGNSGDGPLAFLTIVGDLRMQAGSTWAASIHQPGATPQADPINVTGELDLSAASDTLRFQGLPPFPPSPTSYVLSSYGSRVGEFDTIVGLQPWMSISYTSAENAGPGQVLLNVPEPASVLMFLVVVTAARAHGSRPSHPVALLRQCSRGTSCGVCRTRRVAGQGSN